jgi:hypothetical protein
MFAGVPDRGAAVRPDLLATDLIAALSEMAAPSRPARVGPDPDDLQRVLDDLADRHGDLQVAAPDRLGTVAVQCADGERYRYTAQGVCMRSPRKAHRS